MTNQNKEETKLDRDGFPENAPTALPTFYRTYSRKQGSHRETGADVRKRGLQGMKDLGNYTPEELDLIETYWEQYKSMPSGRWQWIGGTGFADKPGSNYSAYNCTSVPILPWAEDTWGVFGYNFDTLMQGCGSGATIEKENIEKFPLFIRELKLHQVSFPGAYKIKQEDTYIDAVTSDTVYIAIGDTRLGWVRAYTLLLELASKQSDKLASTLNVYIDLGYIRKDGQPIKGFGGVTNSYAFYPGLEAVKKVISDYQGKPLDVKAVCLLLNIAAKIAVAGNVRRSARIDQAPANDIQFKELKDNLYTQDSEGNWKINLDNEALRFANHTRMFKKKPSLEEVREAVEKQYYSSEGAIMYIPEAIARANSDILDTREKQITFIEAYEESEEKGKDYLENAFLNTYQVQCDLRELDHRIKRYNTNPCGEIIG